jgi:hypothetical protein
MLALTTSMEGALWRSLSLINATHPVPLVSPYSALNESPKTNTLRGAVLITAPPSKRIRVKSRRLSAEIVRIIAFFCFDSFGLGQRALLVGPQNACEVLGLKTHEP